MAKDTEFFKAPYERYKATFFSIFRSNWLAWYAFWFLLLYISLIAISILFFDLNPYDQQSSEFFRAPKLTFSFKEGLGSLILGTDDLGRDVYARIIYGAKNTLLFSFGAAILSSLFGYIVGFIVSLYNNTFTRIVYSMIKAMSAYTPIILAFAVVAVLGPSLKNTMCAIAISLFPRYTSITYDLIYSEIQKEYIKAVLLDGVKPLKMLRLSIFPNIRESLIGQFAKNFQMAILDVTALGFLGLCVIDPEPELGTMIAENMDLVFTGNYWLIALPGLAIASFIVALNILGDGIRDAFHKGRN